MIQVKQITPVVGEIYTVMPHRMPGTGVVCGTWNGRVDSLLDGGRAWVQEMKIDGDKWRPSMTTTVDVAALRPLQVQVDLFGDPVGGR